MNILYVVPYVPNLIRVRPYNLIRFLGRQGHRVTALTLWSSEDERADAEKLRAECFQVEALPMPRSRSLWNSLLALPTRAPLQSVYSWQPALAQRLEKLANDPEYDVVHVEHLRGSRYGLHLLDGRKKAPRRIPVLWDSVDCISLLFRYAVERSRSLSSRLITRLEIGRTQHYERWLPSAFDHTVVTSPLDRQALLDLHTPGRPAPAITVLPNGVDLDYFTPGDPAQREPATLIVSGKMSYHANVTMVLYLVNQIMPLVWAKRPDVRLQVVGREPPPELTALNENPNIQVLGGVPHLPPYLQRATLALTPILYGVGIQNKVLEAMACATPVVSTPQAVSALQVETGREIAIAQDPESFAAAVVRLLDNPEERRCLGQAGRTFVEQQHQWPLIARKLEGLYQDLIQREKKAHR